MSSLSLWFMIIGFTDYFIVISSSYYYPVIIFKVGSDETEHGKRSRKT